MMCFYCESGDGICSWLAHKFFRNRMFVCAGFPGRWLGSHELKQQRFADLLPGWPVWVFDTHRDFSCCLMRAVLIFCICKLLPFYSKYTFLVLAVCILVLREAALSFT